MSEKQGSVIVYVLGTVDPFPSRWSRRMLRSSRSPTGRPIPPDHPPAESQENTPGRMH